MADGTQGWWRVTPSLSGKPMLYYTRKMSLKSRGQNGKRRDKAVFTVLFCKAVRCVSVSRVCAVCAVRMMSRTHTTCARTVRTLELHANAHIYVLLSRHMYSVRIQAVTSRILRMEKSGQRLLRVRRQVDGQDRRARRPVTIRVRALLEVHGPRQAGDDATQKRQELIRRLLLALHGFVGFLGPLGVLEDGVVERL